MTTSRLVGAENALIETRSPECAASGLIQLRTPLNFTFKSGSFCLQGQMG
jgi:hypothetical protein